MRARARFDGGRALMLATHATATGRPLAGVGGGPSVPEPSVDLHVHSTASDGSFSPEDVVRLAAEAGLSAFALVDHDTTAGLAAATAAGRRAGIEVVPGVELSIEAAGRSAHLLGLLVDPASRALHDVLEAGLAARNARNPRIVEKLRALSIDITMEEVEAKAREGGAATVTIGRPHIAHVLVEKGAARDVSDAFDRYLASGRPAHVARERLTGERAIAAIHAAGGVAVLAHPVTIAAGSRAAAVAALHRAGLDAIEVLHSKHGEPERAESRAYAREFGLLPSGGSDFHGTPKPDVRIGTGRDGNVAVPYAWLDALRSRAGQRK